VEALEGVGQPLRNEMDHREKDFIMGADEILGWFISTRGAIFKFSGGQLRGRRVVKAGYPENHGGEGRVVKR